VLSMACPSDPDMEALARAAKTGLIVTYEDHHVRTGLGSAVANALADAGLATRLIKLGIARYGSSGIPDELYRSQGLDPENLARTIKSALKS